jgi:uncharacterized phage protein gp47/JayE
MAFSLLTTQQAYDRFLANIEAQINQTTPITPKSFNRVISQVEAMQYTELGKYAAERVKQNLALTATGDDLKKLADEYGVTLRPEVACQLTITLPAVTGTVIPITIDFVGDSNAARFIPDEQATAVFGIAAILVTAQVAGAASNLVVGDTLTLGSPVSGAENTATVNIVRTVGLDEEDEESLRRRVLNEIRTVGGGGNAADYRTWAEEVTNVNRAFPYAGAPLIGIVGFLDGNCNSSATTDWTAGNSATLTKSTADPYEGTRALRIAYNAVSEPFAYQSPLTVGKQYHVTGWARGDGTAIPSVRNLSQFTQWTGTSSTSWQAFDFEFVAAGTDINFYSSAVATGWVEFDNITIVQSNLPGDRTVYIEAVSEVDPDGVAPQSLLDDVRAAINYDPDTSKGRPPLGETDGTLAVESIRRTSFYTEIRNLDVPADQVVSVKSRIEAAVDTYFRGITPFIDGIDAGFDRNDLITSMSLAKVIQEITSTVGGSAASVGFGTELGVFLGSYQLTQGELGKLGAISYA